MEKKTFEEELNDIIRETAQWQNRERTADDTFNERDTCLTAIANAITNYVTGEITRRLTVPSEPTPPPAKSSKRLPTTPSTSGKIRPSLNLYTRSGSSTPTIQRRPGSRATSRPTTPLGEHSTLKKEPMYHSENRLCRFIPTPRADETPLENKASRLTRECCNLRLAFCLETYTIR